MQTVLRPQLLQQLLRLIPAFLLAMAFLGLAVPILATGPGDLDSSFGNSGIVTTTLGSGDVGAAVAIQADGKIVVAGYSGKGGFLDYNFALARYHANGSPDNNFGSNGVVTTPIGYTASGSDLAIQSDGKIIVVGSSDPMNFYYNDFTLVRYHSNGTLDSGFGNNGIVTTSIGIDAYGSGITLDPNGKIVVVGNNFDDNEFVNNLTLIRYNNDGSPDNNFGSNGIVTTFFGSDSYGNQVAIQADDKIVVVGTTYTLNNEAKFALARYNNNGSLDNEFGSGGMVTTPVSLNSYGNDIIVQPDGKIIVLGSASDEDREFFALARYHDDGTLDNSFGNNGVVTTYVGNVAAGYAVALQSDGKIVAAGEGDNGTEALFTLIRYNDDGSLDNSFSNDGVATTSVNGYAEGRAVAIQPDSHIIVTGWSGSEFESQWTLARYLGDEPSANTPRQVYLPVVVKP